MTFMSCGVTVRIKSYLDYVGLTASRQTAMHGLASVVKGVSRNIESTMDKKSKVLPFGILDNVDMH